MLRVRRLLAAAAPAAAVAVLAVVAAATPAAAVTSPYPKGASGYDDSVWQCGSFARGSFTVIAVNNGRPLSTNPCLAAQHAAATPVPAPSFYVNSGYATAYADRVTADCRDAAVDHAPAGDVRTAYAIGCSEGAYDVVAAPGDAPAAWWVDVETANSWSDDRLDLNRAALQGLFDRLAATGRPVGVYSTARQWAEIAGAGWRPAGVDADWPAGATDGQGARAACATTITGAPAWLAQFVDLRGLDVDVAC